MNLARQIGIGALDEFPLGSRRLLQCHILRYMYFWASTSHAGCHLILGTTFTKWWLGAKRGTVAWLRAPSSAVLDRFRPLNGLLGKVERCLPNPISESEFLRLLATILCAQSTWQSQPPIYCSSEAYMSSKRHQTDTWAILVAQLFNSEAFRPWIPWAPPGVLPFVPPVHHRLDKTLDGVFWDAWHMFCFVYECYEGGRGWSSFERFVPGPRDGEPQIIGRNAMLIYWSIRKDGRFAGFFKQLIPTIKVQVFNTISAPEGS